MEVAEVSSNDSFSSIDSKGDNNNNNNNNNIQSTPNKPELIRPRIPKQYSHECLDPASDFLISNSKPMKLPDDVPIMPIPSNGKSFDFSFSGSELGGIFFSSSKFLIIEDRATFPHVDSTFEGKLRGDTTSDDTTSTISSLVVTTKINFRDYVSDPSKIKIEVCEFLFLFFF
jgi:hypothetical protein